MKLVNFTQTFECETCHEARQLLGELTSLSSECDTRKAGGLAEPCSPAGAGHAKLTLLPGAVRLAHQFAMESDQVTADMVEVTEFPHFVHRYRVSGVPKTIVNEARSIDGRVPEDVLLDEVLAAAI